MGLNRRSFLWPALVGWALVASAPFCAAADRTPAYPNVLFIAVDDLNDWTGFLGGHPQAKTPNLDRLARRSMVFTRAYCAAPACNPSRAALMTGIRPSTSGVYHNPQPWRPAMPEATTLPQHFMNHGYHAVGGGKIFHGRFPDPGSWHNYLPKRGDPKPTREVLEDPHSRAGGVIWGELDVDDEAMDDYRVVSWAIDYLEHEYDRPFFLACGIYRPHMPWQVPRKYYELHPVDEVLLPEAPENDLDDVPPAGRRMARPQGDHATVLRTENWRHAVQGYLAAISFADAQVGRLIDALEASPHADNTVIALWGDHGWHLGEKRHWRKFALWEEATRAPLLFAGPGVPPGECDRAVDFMNVYPTLADLCGLPIPGHVEGLSMAPLIADPRAAWPRPALTTHGRNNHAVRSDRWRYIRYANGDEELYDHESDPMEWRNLASAPDAQETKRELARWLPAVNAPDAPSK